MPTEIDAAIVTDPQMTTLVSKRAWGLQQLRWRPPVLRSTTSLTRSRRRNQVEDEVEVVVTVITMIMIEVSPAEDITPVQSRDPPRLPARRAADAACLEPLQPFWAQPQPLVS